MSTETNDPPADSGYFLGADELSEMVRARAARELGIEPPVVGEVHWLWSPGVGPVARVVNLRHVANVVPIRRPGS